MNARILQVKGTPLIKFKEEDKILRLRAGEMHFGSLELYRKLAAENPALGDDYEALLHINKATALIQKIDGGTPTGTPEVHNLENELLYTSYSNGFAFCMFGINPQNNYFRFDDEQKEKMASGFGDTALIIIDSEEFYSRIRLAFMRENFPLNECHCGFVKYYDESVDSIEIYCDLLRGMHNVAFQKRKKYKYQQEFRVLLPCSIVDGDGFDLQIGDITDITEVIPAKTALNGLCLKELQTKEEPTHE